MAEKELKRLGRKELIEIIYELQKREVQLQSKVDRLTEALESRELRTREAGSIAEAALALNGIFEAAQAAADQYLLSVKAAEQETEARRQELLAQAQAEADALVRQGKDTCKAWAKKGELEYKTRVDEAQAECQRIRDEIQSYMLLNSTLKELFPERSSREVSRYA